MSDTPFFQFYASDWLAGTRGLTATETGVYITLVAMMYEIEGPIANDPKRLARLCGSTPAAFKKSVDALVQAGKLTLGDDGFFNRRVQIEIEKRTEKRAAASQSAKVRWDKNKQNQGSENANASDPQCVRNANQNPEPEKKKEEPTGSSKKRGSRLTADWVLPKAWGEWAMAEGLSEVCVRREADSFRDWWVSATGAKATKLDWQATWRGWVRRKVDDQKRMMARRGVSGGGLEIGTIREVGGVRKQYAGNGTGWLVIHE